MLQTICAMEKYQSLIARVRINILIKNSNFTTKTQRTRRILKLCVLSGSMVNNYLSQSHLYPFQNVNGGINNLLNKCLFFHVGCGSNAFSGSLDIPPPAPTA